MEMLQKLETMYEYARSNGYCKNRKTLAELMGTTESAISRAFAGGSLSTKFLLRVNEAIGGVFSPAWILYDQGDMFAQSSPAAPEQEISAPVAEIPSVAASSESRTIKHLETLVETLQSHVAVLERYNNHLEEENEALKKANSYVYAVRAKNA